MSRLETLIRNFEESAVMKAFKGCRDPETWDEIDRRYDKDRRALVYTVTMLRVACNEILVHGVVTKNSMHVETKYLEEMSKRMNEVNE